LETLPGVYAPLSAHDRRMEPLPSYGDPHAAFVQTAAVHAHGEISPDAYAGQPPYAGPSDIASYASQGYGTQSYPQTQYRAHASSMLAGGYSVGPTTMYDHPQYSNSVSSLASSAGSHSPYDSNASSSFSNLKSSPLSQNDGTYAYHASDAGSRAGAYAQQALDRRPSNLSLASSFSSGYPDNYSPLGFDGQQHYYDQSEAYATGSHSTQTTPEVVAETVQATLPQSTQMEMAPNYDGYNHTAEAPYTPSIDSMLADVRFQRNPDIRDLETFMKCVFARPTLRDALTLRDDRPFLDEYTRTPNRLAFGERTVIVMTSKVAQKSYGTEKRLVASCLFFRGALMSTGFCAHRRVPCSLGTRGGRTRRLVTPSCALLESRSRSRASRRRRKQTWNGPTRMASPSTCTTLLPEQPIWGAALEPRCTFQMPTSGGRRSRPLSQVCRHTALICR
jgi:hypothetical protein